MAISRIARVRALHQASLKNGNITWRLRAVLTLALSGCVRIPFVSLADPRDTGSCRTRNRHAPGDN